MTSVPSFMSVTPRSVTFEAFVSGERFPSFRFKELVVEVQIVFVSKMQHTALDGYINKQRIQLLCGIKTVSFAFCCGIDLVLLCQLCHGTQNSVRTAKSECGMLWHLALQDIDVFCSVSAAEEIACHREEYLAVLISDRLASSSEKLVYVWHYKTLKLVFHEEKTAKRGDFLKFC